MTALRQSYSTAKRAHISLLNCVWARGAAQLCLRRDNNAITCATVHLDTLAGAGKAAGVQQPGEGRIAMLDLAAFLMLQASVAYERQLRCVTACTCGRGAAR